MKVKLLLLLALAFCFSYRAGAQSYSEGGDLSNIITGATTFTDGAAGSYTYSGNISTPNDYQDDFWITIPCGFQITSVTYSLSGGGGFQGFMEFNFVDEVFPGAASSGTFPESYPLQAGTYDVINGADFSVGNHWSITVTVTALPLPVITANPSNTSSCAGSGASFTMSATNANSYQWQISTNGGGSWTNVSGGVYSGETTTTLSISNVAGLGGDLFRCNATNCAGTVSTSGATLTLGTPSNWYLDADNDGFGNSNTLTGSTQMSQAFDNISTAFSNGWAQQNLSSPPGTSWFQGDNTNYFSSHSGAANSYISSDYNALNGSGTISNWLFTPPVTLQNGAQFVFYSRCEDNTQYPDRMQVRMSTNGGSVNVGNNSSTVGDFTTLLLDINPSLVTGVYPMVWTQYTITVSGLSSSVTGRFAFRYFVDNGGTGGTNSYAIGIDDVSYLSPTSPISACTAPSGYVSNNTDCDDANPSIHAAVTPAVSLAITNGSQTGCAGSSVTFTATPTNGGGAPHYQFKVNGNNVGGNNTTNTFTSTTLANNDVVTCVMTSSLSSCLTTSTATSNGITMTINTSVTPGVSIAITNGSQTGCSGSSVTFTATPSNGGPSPTYNFMVNGGSVQNSSSATYTTTGLSNNNQVTCTMTANNACQTTATANSNAITMTITTSVTPGVSMTITNGSQTGCSGNSVTFTATPSNGGPSPVYNFKVNGGSVQNGSSNTYTTSGLNNNDQVTCTMTANNACQTSATANSNTITMTITSGVTPGVSIAITNGSQTSCNGIGVTFTATPSNGGSSPTYNFMVNGGSVQNGSSATYTTSGLNNNDQVTCTMTANNACQSSATANSNSITMTITNGVTPSVSISITAGSQTSCSGSGVTFTAATSTGGSSPTFDFQVNGSSVQNSSSNTYSTSGLNNNDVVQCIMTANNPCQSTATASSNTITMTITTMVTPAVSLSITAGGQTSCSGNGVTFTAATSTGGPSPTFNFQVNSISVQNSNSNTYATTGLNNNDVVQCIMTANNACQTTATAGSNTITMTISSTSVGGFVTNDAAVCSGNNSGTLNLSGQNGNVIGWEYSIDGGNNWIAISNTTTAQSYLNLTTTTMYHALVQNGVCPVAVSSPATISVSAGFTPAVSIAITNGSQTSCSGSSITFTATPSNGGSAPTYNFMVNGGSVQNSSSATFTTTSLGNNDQVTCVMMANNTCQTTPTANSNGITVTINLQPSVFSMTGGGTFCSGGIGVPVGLSNSENGVNYQLFYNGNPVGTPVPGTGLPLNFGTFPIQGTYTATAAGTGGCSANMSGNAVVVQGAALVAGTVSSNAIICPSTTFSATLTGSNCNLIDWQSSPTPNIPGSWTSTGVTNTTSFTSGVLSSNTYFRALVTSSGCYSAVTNSVQATMAVMPVVSLSNVTDVSMVATWTPNQNSGAQYAVTVNPGGTVYNNASSPLSISGLTPGTLYTVSVSLTNPSCGINDGVASASTTCPAPSVATATSVSNNVEQISWTSSGTTDSIIYRNMLNNNYLRVLATSNPMNITVSAAATYMVFIRSVCNNSNVVDGPISYFTSTGTSCSTPPVITSFTAGCDAELTVNWSSVPGITSYKVNINRITPSPLAVSFTITGNTYTYFPAMAGATYQAEVRSICTGGSFSPAAVSQTITLNNLLPAPDNVVVSANTCHGFTVSWSPVSGATAYMLKREKVGGLTYTYTVTGTAYSLSGLTENSLYNISVASIQACSGATVSTGAYGPVVGTATTICREEESNPVPAIGDLHLYPNPNDGQFNVSFENNTTQPVTYLVTNVLGQVIYQSNVTEASGLISKTINLEQAASGIYYFSIKTNDAVITKQVMIAR